MPEYYDGTKLLSLQDINNNKPEIFMCTTNRTGGKTTYFSRFLINKFKKMGEKFMLLYRFDYELSNCAEQFFKDIKGLFFQDDDLSSKCRAKGSYYELFLNEEPCGYAVAINSSDKIKRYSHVFSDVQRIFFDEFQSETGHYCPDEITKFQSIHVSVARGQGKQVRYVPVYMCANTVTLLNPYYIAMDISIKLNKETKFLRGDGFVLEQGYVDSASRAQLESGFNRAFSGSKYVAYSAQNVYLNDNESFIDKPAGRPRYMATLKYLGCEYSIKEYKQQGIIFCDDSVDSSFKYKITVTTDDHQINYVMLRNNDMFLNLMKFYFEKGCVRFKNLKCKEAFLKSLYY